MTDKIKELENTLKWILECYRDEIVKKRWYLTEEDLEEFKTAIKRVGGSYGLPDTVVGMDRKNNIFGFLHDISALSPEARVCTFVIERETGTVKVKCKKVKAGEN